MEFEILKLAARGCETGRNEHGDRPGLSALL